MGGYGGEVRARSPEELWDKFVREIRPDAEERFGLFLEAPVDREQAFRAMRQDAESKFWVLDFYFSK